MSSGYVSTSWRIVTEPGTRRRVAVYGGRDGIAEVAASIGINGLTTGYVVRGFRTARQFRTENHRPDYSAQAATYEQAQELAELYVYAVRCWPESSQEWTRSEREHESRVS